MPACILECKILAYLNAMPACILECLGEFVSELVDDLMTTCSQLLNLFLFQTFAFVTVSYTEVVTCLLGNVSSFLLQIPGVQGWKLNAAKNLQFALAQEVLTLEWASANFHSLSVHW